jgi:hypothetical protein
MSLTVFLGNQKAESSRDVVRDPVQSYTATGCDMSLELQFLGCHLDFPPEGLGTVRDERGERFPQDISAKEKRYQGKWIRNMLADYCWTRDVPQAKCSRKSSIVTF